MKKKIILFFLLFFMFIGTSSAVELKNMGENWRSRNDAEIDDIYRYGDSYYVDSDKTLTKYNANSKKEITRLEFEVGIYRIYDINGYFFIECGDGALWVLDKDLNKIDVGLTDKAHLQYVAYENNIYSLFLLNRNSDNENHALRYLEFNDNFEKIKEVVFDGDVAPEFSGIDKNGAFHFTQYGATYRYYKFENGEFTQLPTYTGGLKKPELDKEIKKHNTKNEFLNIGGESEIRSLYVPEGDYYNLYIIAKPDFSNYCLAVLFLEKETYNAEFVKATLMYVDMDLNILWQKEISKRELNPHLYGEVNYDSEVNEMSYISKITISLWMPKREIAYSSCLKSNLMILLR